MDQLNICTGNGRSQAHLVISPGENYTVEEGRSTAFSCKIIGGNSQQQIVWYGVNDRKIKKDFRWLLSSTLEFLCLGHLWWFVSQWFVVHDFFGDCKKSMSWTGIDIELKQKWHWQRVIYDRNLPFLQNKYLTLTRFQQFISASNNFWKPCSVVILMP